MYVCHMFNKVLTYLLTIQLLIKHDKIGMKRTQHTGLGGTIMLCNSYRGAAEAINNIALHQMLGRSRRMGLG